MNNDINPQKNQHNSKAIVGIILLGLGCVLLLREFHFFYIPDSIELWPLWLVFWGVVVGSRSNFQKPSSYILVALGMFLLIINNIPHAGNFAWPLGIIGVGLWMILRRRSGFDKNQWNKENRQKWDWQAHTGVDPNQPPVVDTNYTEVPPGGPSPYPPTGDDFLDAVSVFGGVKKTILSKNFRGGDIVNIFGGAELDLTQADINGHVIIDITQIFGGTKIIVPSNWQVVSDIAAVFASVDDKRMKTGAPLNSNKILVLKGVSIFAGIDIRSY